MSTSEHRPPLDSELARQQIQLYMYGELSLRERLEVERSCVTDTAFSELFKQERVFLESIGGNNPADQVEILLENCRRDLSASVSVEKQCIKAGALPGLFDRLRDLLRKGFTAGGLVWQPAISLVLVAMGFFIGRSFNPGTYQMMDSPQAVRVAAKAVHQGDESVFSEIQTVQHGLADGQVNIVLEERRVVSGHSSDPYIRGMLLDTIRESHPGARLTSLEALGRQASDSKVRQQMLKVMLEDENLGVRLKALEVLDEHCDQPEVRRALLQVMREDPNAGMRVLAIEHLQENPGKEMAGALQDILKQESNPFIQKQCERILEALGASVEHY